jgi:hypothetical protein
LPCGVATGAQQVDPVPGHALGAGGIEQVGGVGEAGGQALGMLFGGQGEVELGGAALAFDHLGRQAQAAAGGASAALLPGG